MLEPLPFDDSRRLTGPNLYFAETGAVLETLGAGADAAANFAAWEGRVQRACAALQWPAPGCVTRLHQGGAALALRAPRDQLFTATEVNEWAWLGSLGCHALHAPGHPASWDEGAAMRTLQAMASAEADPELCALLAAANARGLPFVLDDDSLSLGLGHRGRTWPLTDIPAPATVDWPALGAMPVALVSGSNGKTTSVRLVAAMLRAQGLHTAYTCTDGVYIDGDALTSGDYSGPAGARRALRHPDAQAAVLECARGGLLRRGLAIDHADAALITNISADHFGEYGIDDLDGLTEAKLILARALDDDGILVLNADDAQLCAHGAGLNRSLAWFALDDAHPRLAAHRRAGGRTCGYVEGQLWLSLGPIRHPLGDCLTMPLSADGQARYNLANIAGAVLLADALGVAIEVIREVLRHFGKERSDNPGRLECWRFGGVQVLMDYAHNPEGLRGLLEIAQARRGEGRLALLLGQAGNRSDEDIRALAGTAAAFEPELVVLKDLDGYLRGRAAGEVAGLLRDELLRHGIAAAQLQTQLREADAARSALAWARHGDVLVLPVHAATAKTEVAALLDRLQASGWAAGDSLD